VVKLNGRTFHSSIDSGDISALSGRWSAADELFQRTCFEDQHPLAGTSPLLNRVRPDSPRGASSPHTCQDRSNRNSLWLTMRPLRSRKNIAIVAFISAPAASVPSGAARRPIQSASTATLSPSATTDRGFVSLCTQQLLPQQAALHELVHIALLTISVRHVRKLDLQRILAENRRSASPASPH